MELSRTRTSSHDVEYTRRPLSSDAVARPAGESSKVGVNGGSVLENANEPVVPSFRVWHWQHVTKRPVVRPREPHAVLGNRVDLATQRHRFVTTGCDLAPLVTPPASRGIWNPKIIIIIIITTTTTTTISRTKVLAFHADQDRRAATPTHGIDRLARVLACVGQSEHPQRQRVRGYQRSLGHIVLQSIILQRSNPVRWCFALPRGETRSLPCDTKRYWSGAGCCPRRTRISDRLLP